MQNKSFKMNSSMDQGQTIVQCPQCQTKFAVDSAVLAEVAAPRFHCSRCDFVFAFETKAAAAAEKPMQNFAAPEPRAQQAESQPRAAAANQPSAWTMGIPSVDRGGAARALEIPKNVESAPRASAPHETHRDNFDFTQMKLDFRKPVQSELPASSFDDISAFTVPEAAPQRSASNESPPAIDYQRPVTSWSALVYTAAPLVAFLSLLIGVSYYLRQNNERAESLYAAMADNTAQVAPAELNLLNPKFKRIALDSGEAAYLVSGSVKNTSDRTFHDVVIEGLGFDESGELVARTQVDAGATLAKTRIRSLTPEMIKNLQSGQLKNRVELKPGASEDFSFALIDGEPSKARFFSARIYSVTE